MATTEEIISIYRAEVQGYISEIEKIIVKVRTLEAEKDKQVKGDNSNTKQLIASAQARNKLLQDEVKNLHNIEAASKKAFTIPEIKEFNSKIAESKNNIALLKGETSSLGNLTGGLKSQFLGIGAGIAAAFSVGALVSFGKASIESFEEAERSAKLLESAIKNVGGGDDSTVGKFLDQAKQLQKITIFNDEQIQAAQTLAFQFGLTQKQVEDLIPVVADFASATGQDLQTSLESVLRATEGQGRGLKVYGVSIKDTGDRSKDLANITDQLNAKFQGQAEILGNTASGAIAKFNNQLDEIKEKVGGFLTRNVLGPVVDTLSQFVNAIDSLGNSDLENLTNEFEKQAKATKELEQTINPLTERYDELKAKTSLNKDEQVELNGIILKIGQALPGTVTQFDKYGNALDINRSKVAGFLKEQANFTQIKEAAAIKEIIRDSQEAAEKIELITHALNKATSDANKFSGGTAGIQNFLKQTQTQLAQAQDQLLKNNELLKTDFQTELPTALKKYLDAATSAKFGEVKINTGAKEEINNLEKLNTDLKKFQDDLKALPLNKLNIPIDLNEFERLKKAIADTQKAIDDITGKSAEESKKKSEDRIKQALADEKKLIEDINKLRVELAPTQEEKSIIQFEVDQKSLNSTIADVRSLNQIQKDIDTEKITFIRLNALKLVNDLKIIDDKRLEDIRKAFEEELKIKNQPRIDAANTGAAESISSLKEQFDSEKDLQDAINKERLNSFEKGSVQQLEVQKDIIHEQAANDILQANASIDNQTARANKITAIEKNLGISLSDIDEQIAAEQQRQFAETFQEIGDIASAFFQNLTELQTNNIQEQIKNAEDNNAAQQQILADDETRLKDSLSKKLISQKEFDRLEGDLQKKKLAADQANQVKINQLKKEQAEKEKLLKIFTIGLELAEAIAQLNYFKAAIDVVELAFVIGTGIPAFKHGTKKKKGSGLALVGEEGAELVDLPNGSGVLPSRQTIKHKSAINAMFDNSFDEFIEKEYVIPATIEHEKNVIERERLQKQKEISTLKKSLNEIIETVVSKKTSINEVSEIEKMMLSKENKALLINKIHSISRTKNEITREDAISSFKAVATEIVNKETSINNSEVISGIIKKVSEKIINKSENIISEINALNVSAENKTSLIESVNNIKKAKSIEEKNMRVESLKFFSENIIRQFNESSVNNITKQVESKSVNLQNEISESIISKVKSLNIESSLSEKINHAVKNIDTVSPELQSQRIKSIQQSANEHIQTKESANNSTLTQKRNQIESIEKLIIQKQKTYNEIITTHKNEISKQHKYSFENYEINATEKLIAKKSDSEKLKQKYFAENIAAAIMINTSADSKPSGMSMYDYLFANRNGTKIRNFEQIAESIAEKISDKIDSRKF